MGEKVNNLNREGDFRVVEGKYFLPNSYNSMVIELCKDIIRIRQKIETCQWQMYIAELTGGEIPPVYPTMESP